MKVEVRRFEFGDKYTIGRMYIDGEYYCYTLEDKVRPTGEKVAGETAIPYGTYNLVVDSSQRFARDMPHILNVPNFEGVRVHPGNTDKDTEGCILVGGTWAGGDFVGNSRSVFEPFLNRLIEAGNSTISVLDGGQTS